MATVTHDDLSVCVDCAAIIANGELGQGDHAADRAHADRIAAQWRDVPGDLVLTGQADGSEHYGTSPCDGCGTHLHGARFDAAVIA